MESTVSILRALTLASVSALPATAWAADIASVIGAPNSAAWLATCPAVAQAPAGTSQLNPCAGSDCLNLVEIDNSVYPHATCSDGTPGVFYVREGSAADRDKWVIHLQGGSACRNFADCAARWCGVQGGGTYRANKMSSDWDGDGVSDLLTTAQGGGMASSNPLNAFSTWTHVFAYYCSSDNWMGRKTSVPFSLGSTTFTVDANGHRILRAMRSMLRNQTAGHGLPDLDAATDIIFSGTSAGARGALQNADWFLAPLTGPKKALIIDANMDASDNVLLANDVWVDTDLDGVGDEIAYSHRIGFEGDMWQTGGYWDAVNGFADETCRGHYEALGRMDRCNQFSTLLLFNLGGVPMIETPTLLRMDLHDNTVRKYWTQHPNAGGFSMIVGGAHGHLATVDDFAVLMRETLTELYADRDSVTAAFAPKCTTHVGLEATAPFVAHRTPDTTAAAVPAPIAGTESNFHDAVVDWYNVGGAFQSMRRLDTDEPGVTFSVCN